MYMRLTSHPPSNMLEKDLLTFFVQTLLLLFSFPSVPRGADADPPTNLDDGGTYGCGLGMRARGTTTILDDVARHPRSSRYTLMRSSSPRCLAHFRGVLRP
jgi:hypothetical protein